MKEKQKGRNDLMNDDDDYVVLSQDDVVEGVAVFVAKLILANPRAQVRH